MNFLRWVKTCAPGGSRWPVSRGAGRRSWLTIALCAALLLWALVPIVSSLGTGQNANAAPGPQTSASGGRTILGNIDETQLTVLRGNTVPMARKEFDRGAAPAALPMDRMFLVLKRSPEKEAALQKLMAEQQNPSSPNFHKWLTPEQFGQQFGLSDTEIQTVTTWLESQGFTVNRVSKGRTLIEFSGMAATVQKSFHTSIHKYLVNGEEHWANESDPQIPSALAPLIVGVNSLNNFRRHPAHHIAGQFTREKATGKVHAVNPQFSLPNNFTCGTLGTDCNLMGPTDFATIYNILPLWNAGIDGTGQTIAVVGRSNINIQDVHNFRALFGLPTNDPTVIVNGADPGLVPGDESEALLDVQWSGAVAKGATIKFVTSKSTNTSDGVDLSSEFIINNSVAPVMSESFGLCELQLGTAGNQFYNTMWSQAATQGITVLLSTGDSGSAGCDVADPNIPGQQPATNGLQVSGLSSTPFNTAVGGTDFDQVTNAGTFWATTNDPATKASALSYIPETTWNDSCTNAVWGTAAGGLSPNPETNCNNTSVTPSFIVAVGGSGGASNCTTPANASPASCSGGYAKPVWQVGTGVPADGKRDQPDVSMFAGDGLAGTFYVICEADLNNNNVPCDLSSPFQNFIGVGGTSVSVQVFAGVMALVNQRTHTTQGLANPTLYLLASQQSASNCNSSSNPTASCIFYDTTNGTIAAPCKKGSPNCTVANPADANGILSGFAAGTGFDNATGLGSVNVTNLANAWATAANPVDFTFGTPSPTSNTVTAGNPAVYTIPVNVVATAGLVELSCSGLPAGAACNITPNNPITSGNSATVTITTTAHSKVPPANPSIRQRLLPVSGMWILLAALLTVAAAFSIKVGAERRLVFVISGVCLVAFLSLQVGCGGGSGGGGGGGGSPSASFAPTTLGFASTVVGSTAAAQTVGLTNNGSGTLSISGISVAGTNAADFSQTNTCGATLVVGTNCTISVTFKPSIVGAESATISVADNATGSPQTVSLSGTGASGSNASFNPTSLSFGSQKVSIPSAAKTVTLNNTGTAALAITAVSVTGTNAADFTQTNTCGSSVAAKGNCTFSVIFKPTLDAAESASLNVTDNAGGSPQSVPLIGTGTGGPQAVLNPTSLPFGNQAVGVTTAPKPVTLTNNGDATLVISSLTITGANAADFVLQSNTCGASVAPGVSCTLNVTFKASAAAAESAAITIADNGLGNPHTVPLSGTGLATPAGTYTITITGQSGANQHTTTVQLIVQ